MFVTPVRALNAGTPPGRDSGSGAAHGGLRALGRARPAGRGAPGRGRAMQHSGGGDCLPVARPHLAGSGEGQEEGRGETGRESGSESGRESERARVGRGRVRGASEPKQAGAHTHTHAQDDLHNNGVRVRLDCLRMGEMFHAYVVLGAHRLYAPVLGNGDEGVLVDFAFEAAALKRQPDG